MDKKTVRHILGLSGGKDSAALAMYLHSKIPNIEYFFCDTGCELPETYEYLDRLKARLGIEITYLNKELIPKNDPEAIFKHWLTIYNGFLPSARARWCTKQLKIIPLEKFIDNDEAISYIAIRADEDRDGYISTKDNINPVYPFKEDGITKKDVFRILEESSIGLPKYYEWRSRSGCYFCFFQRKIEWIRLHDNHPDLFLKAAKYENEHSDGRTFTWNKDETLLELLKRRDKIIAEHNKIEMRLKKEKPNRTLIDILSELDKVEGFNPCSICHL
jgi:3'-phosphoadenosine 5'-phosphosulfate sulfotransferase (PAPS reductase)/FAD synthetase